MSKFNKHIPIGMGVDTESRLKMEPNQHPRQPRERHMRLERRLGPAAQKVPNGSAAVHVFACPTSGTAETHMKGVAFLSPSASPVPPPSSSSTVTSCCGKLARCLQTCTRAQTSYTSASEGADITQIRG